MTNSKFNSGLITKPKIALVYDRVNTAHGGAEQVLLALHRQFPEAPLYCGLANLDKAKWAQTIDVRPSFLRRFPSLANHHRRLAAILPFALESLDLSEFEVIISITSAECKAVITRPNQLHICYLLTPPRYLYSHYQSQLAALPWLIQGPAKLALKYLRWWDQAAMSRPDLIVPISKLISARLIKYYPNLTFGSESDKSIKNGRQLLTPPITPPAESFSEAHQEFNQLSSQTQQQIIHHFGSLPKNYLLQFGRLVEYKRNDLSIKAAIKLGQNLIVVGNGPESARLKEMAAGHDNICFLNHLDRPSLGYLVKNARACLFPALEDFGISALETQLSGTPVVIHHQSGVGEVLAKDLTFTIVKETLSEMTQVISKIMKRRPQTDIMTRSGPKYDTLSFQSQFEKLVTTYWSKHDKS